MGISVTGCLHTAGKHGFEYPHSIPSLALRRAIKAKNDMYNVIIS